jgi:hypothetical protein
MSEAKPNIRQMTQKLRLQTCALLKLDPDKLSPGDEVLVARIGSLKVLVSDLEAAQLRGEKIDVADYVKASEALESAVRTDHRMTEMGTPQALEAARDKLRMLLGDIVPDFDPDNPPRSEADILREENARLRDELAELRARAAVPVQPAPEPLPSNVKYLPSRTADGRPPPHYLREGQSREPWRDYEGRRDEALIAPYFDADPTGR